MTTTSKEPMNEAEAVIYVRVASVAPNSEGKKCRLQEQRCRALATARGYSVTHVFRDEGVSGNQRERPGLDAMLAYLVSLGGRETIILMENITRLARDMAIHVELKEWIEAAGARIETCDDAESDRVRAIPYYRMGDTVIWRILP